MLFFKKFSLLTTFWKLPAIFTHNGLKKKEKSLTMCIELNFAFFSALASSIFSQKG
jgi:hypothetical protein